MEPGAIFASTVRTKVFGVGMNSDERRIFDIAEVCVGKFELLFFWIQGRSTHDIVRVDVLDYDALGR